MNTPFELPAELTIYGVLNTRDALLNWVTAQTAHGKNHLEVSAQQVSEVDGAGLQLIAALSNMDLNWHMVNASQPFVEACTALGLTAWLPNMNAVTSKAAS